MDHFHRLKRQVQHYIFLLGTLAVAFLVGGAWVIRRLFPDNNDVLVSGGLLLFGWLVVWLLSVILTNYALQPLETIWRAILHVTPGHTSTAPPNLEKSKIGQELVTTLALQVYQLASSNTSLQPVKPTSNSSELESDIFHNFPLPIMAVSKNQTISIANEAALKFLGLTKEDVFQKNLYSVFDLAFSDERTLDNWLQHCRQNKATDQHFWQRVRLKLADQTTVKQFDLAAAYSKENPNDIEVIITLFDQTARYQIDDEALDFIALAVHELRTPLTALRGYIELFDDELGDKLDPELLGFMHSMQTSAQQLTAFVSNILNVARIQEGQLSLQLTEETWEAVIKNAVDNMALAAKLKGISIDYTIAPNLPSVAVDKISITEVLNNLLDNAIKYSGSSKLIHINAGLTNDGLVETVVSDDGVGIPSSVMPNLFEKFHRNHRNQARIGGTGLGLYLCASLIKAHGGNIWLKSKEGEGTSVGFTVQPYSMLAGKLKDSNNKGITRNAHGWIKNHSLYRR